MTGLITHSLKNKKSWFLLNLAITIVIAIILPILFKSSYSFFAGCAMFFASVIILISTFSDLVFLHDDRKISYFLSKPISLTNKINIALISNFIFCTVTFVLTFFISSFAGSVLSNIKYTTFVDNYLSFIQVMYAWLMMLIFVIAFSSELTGNTTVSVLVTLFNFTLPIIFYLVVTYIFYILDSVIIGINTEIMARAFLDNFLPLDKIYFIDYGMDGNIDVFFFFRLLAYCAVVYILTVLFAKIRKNERTGDFIVHSGFKYFMSLFASLIAPMLITMLMAGTNLFTLVVVLVILSTLAYYILISAFNKTFKISSHALKIYIPFIAAIVIAIFTSSYVVNARAAFIPDDSDVKAVYIGGQSSYLEDARLLKPSSYKWKSLLNVEYGEIKDNDDLVILHENESIKKVIELQQALMKQKSGYRYDDITIIYYLNNGKKIVRSYSLADNYQEEASEIDKLIYKASIDLARTEEFIRARYRIFYDEDYLNAVSFERVYVYDLNETKTLLYFDYKEFAKNYIQDYKNFMNNDENIEKVSLNVLYGNRAYEFAQEKYGRKDGDSTAIPIKQGNDIVEINFESLTDDGISIQYLQLRPELINTKRYVESLKLGE